MMPTIEAVTDIPVVAVKGNCDFYSDPGKRRRNFMAEDKRVLFAMDTIME